MHFETSSRKSYQVGEFCSHFKKCLPKIAMISSGVRGNSNDNTFDQGEVVVILPKNHNGLIKNPKDFPERPAGSSVEYVDGYFIVEGDICGEPVHLPIDLKDLRVVEVTGIKGQDKEQWKTYQQKIKRQLTKAESAAGNNGNVYETLGQNSSQQLHTINTKQRRRKVKTPTEAEDEYRQTVEPSTVGPEIITPQVDQNITRQSSLISQLAEELDKRKKGSPNSSTRAIPSMKVLPITRTSTQHYTNLGDLGNNQSDQLYQNQNSNVERIYANHNTGVDTAMSRSDQKSGQIYENHFSLYPACPDGNHMFRHQEYSKHAAGQSKEQHVDVYATARISMVTDGSSTHLQLDFANQSNKNLTVEEIRQLTIEDVSDYLKILQLHDYVEIFANNQVDGALLTELDEDILTSDFKMRKFEAKKLRNFSKEGRLPASRTSVPANNK